MTASYIICMPLYGLLQRCNKAIPNFVMFSVHQSQQNLPTRLEKIYEARKKHSISAKLLSLNNVQRNTNNWVSNIKDIYLNKRLNIMALDEKKLQQTCPEHKTSKIGKNNTIFPTRKHIYLFIYFILFFFRNVDPKPTRPRSLNIEKKLE